MLAQEDALDADSRLDAMPKLPLDESVAHQGDRIGPYRLITEIGRGGMGTVWLAERADGAYKRQVALKLPRLAWGAGLAERMAREREIGMLLEHPNIARLYDAGVDERGRPFLALEFVDGQPIDAWCEAQGLNVRERLKLSCPWPAVRPEPSCSAVPDHGQCW
jgi:serine/threonine-protein kinase